MLAHQAEPLIKAQGADYPFLALRDELTAADIAFGNLETPISTGTGRPHPRKEYRFITRPANAEGLARAGFDILSVANNHTGDFGSPVFLDTLGHLQKWGIQPVGGGRNSAEARRPALFNVRERRIAFLAYSHTHPMEFHAGPKRPGTAFPTEEIVALDVGSAKKIADRVIVSFHWGKEYNPRPTPSQRSLAYAAVDAGADAVIGHHPHTYQGVEVRNGKPIVYSVGNFAFGTRNAKARHGLFVWLRLPENGDAQLEIRPLLVDAARVHFQPRFLDGPEAEDVLSRLQALSEDLQTPLRIEGLSAFFP